jgi:hypothetical protein
MSERKQFKAFDDLNARLDRQIAKGYLSLEAQREMLREICERHGYDKILAEIRRLN